MNRLQREWDVWVYLTLFLLLSIYVAYLRKTCEEIGCLSIIFPITLIGILSVIEFALCLFVINRRRSAVAERILVILLSGLITFFSAFFALYAAVNN